MSVYDGFKNGIEGVVSASVGLVIHTVIAKNTPADLKFLPRIGMRFGTLIIGTILSNMAAKAITDNLDVFVEGVSESVKEAEAALQAKDDLVEEVIPYATNDASATMAIYEAAPPFDVSAPVTPKPKRKPAAKTSPKASA